MFKRRLAVQFTVERFKECRFWTFTFRRACSPDRAAKCWKALSRLITKEWPEARGVRVFELHPGGHGIHVHVATPAWMSVRKMRDLTSRAGFGRIHVVAWKRWRLTAGEYLSKYLAKKRPECLRGRRLVGTFGIPRDERTCQCDITVESPLSYVWNVLAGLPNWHSMNFNQRSSMAQGVVNQWIDEGDDFDAGAAAVPYGTPEGRSVWKRQLNLVILRTISQAEEIECLRSRTKVEIFSPQLQKKLERGRHALAMARLGRMLYREPSYNDEICANEYNDEYIASQAIDPALCPF